MPYHDAPVSGGRGAAAPDPKHGASTTHARTAAESSRQERKRRPDGPGAHWDPPTESGMSCSHRGALAASHVAGLQCTMRSVHASGELHSGQAMIKMLLE